MGVALDPATLGCQDIWLEPLLCPVPLHPLIWKQGSERRTHWARLAILGHVLVASDPGYLATQATEMTRSWLSSNRVTHQGGPSLEEGVGCLNLAPDTPR